jgi:hypothetical protein
VGVLALWEWPPSSADALRMDGGRVEERDSMSVLAGREKAASRASQSSSGVPGREPRAAGGGEGMRSRS